MTRASPRSRSNKMIYQQEASPRDHEGFDHEYRSTWTRENNFGKNYFEDHGCNNGNGVGNGQGDYGGPTPAIMNRLHHELKERSARYQSRTAGKEMDTYDPYPSRHCRMEPTEPLQDEEEQEGEEEGDDDDAEQHIYIKCNSDNTVVSELSGTTGLFGGTSSASVISDLTGPTLQLMERQMQFHLQQQQVRLHHVQQQKQQQRQLHQQQQQQQQQQNEVKLELPSQLILEDRGPSDMLPPPPPQQNPAGDFMQPFSPEMMMMMQMMLQQQQQQQQRHQLLQQLQQQKRIQEIQRAPEAASLLDDLQQQLRSNLPVGIGIIDEENSLHDPALPERPVAMKKKGSNKSSGSSGRRSAALSTASTSSSSSSDGGSGKPSDQPQQQQQSNQHQHQHREPHRRSVSMTSAMIQKRNTTTTTTIINDLDRSDRSNRQRKLTERRHSSDEMVDIQLYSPTPRPKRAVRQHPPPKTTRRSNSSDDSTTPKTSSRGASRPTRSRRRPSTTMSREDGEAKLEETLSPPSSSNSNRQSRKSVRRRRSIGGPSAAARAGSMERPKRSGSHDGLPLSSKETQQPTKTTSTAESSRSKRSKSPVRMKSSSQRSKHSSSSSSQRPSGATARERLLRKTASSKDLMHQVGSRLAEGALPYHNSSSGDDMSSDGMEDRNLMVINQDSSHSLSKRSTNSTSKNKDQRPPSRGFLKRSSSGRKLMRPSQKDFLDSLFETPTMR